MRTSVASDRGGGECNGPTGPLAAPCRRRWPCCSRSRPGSGRRRIRWTRSSADEILAAANILLQGRAAQPGAIFQSIDLREPPQAARCSAFVAARRRRPRGDRLLPPEQAELQDDGQPDARHVHAAGADPDERRPARPDDHRGVDFTFAFQDPAFLRALALRGIARAQQLQKVFVTPLTPGSFGLPEESRRIVKAQMYYTEGARHQPLRAADRGRCRRSSTSTSA